MARTFLHNTANRMHTSLSLHFIGVQYLDMFRALHAHPQEALNRRRIGGYCVQLSMWVGLSIWEDLEVFPYPETNPHLQLHNIATSSASV
jgi:hypothetical protein